MTIFNWKTLQAGLLFLLVQAPTLILVVPAGLLKDKVGTPGTAGTEWANRGNEGRTIFILALLAIGVWRTLPLGFGAIEVLRKYILEL
ncbi:MFS general substrate transporter [Penicillium macrosclerotiorum]|uniref:MFS general substrate transporter n=1 Tax=Penicillium macrosclerotiorum TaxID=303699 RepID=UPI002548B15D|nr:MFS general substrate transporter [Penicillium macrosclerotiorum]KAJ5682150.1 MFS general substrate transporter [Penicillium macrosclerotiorum]